MKKTVRLDSVVRVKELAEERALKLLASAQRAAQAAREEAQAAKERVMRDARMSGAVEFWEMAETAHQKARTELQQAEERCAQNEKKVEKARAEHLVARNKAEAVRRVAEVRRQELYVEIERKETQRLDEIASVLHWRKTS